MSAGVRTRGVVLLLTVDVEEDMPRWVPEREITTHNVVALPRLQRLCDDFGVPPTYLTTYRMAIDAAAAGVLGGLQASGRCEIGAHLHPWNTPPLPDGPELQAVRATQIPVDAMRAKLHMLTDTLEEVFGTRPRSYRAGRFGLNGVCLQALEDLGYAVDTSVVPGICMRDEGGEDFTDAPVGPYFPDRTDPRRPGDCAVYEVPVSAGLTVALGPRLRQLYLHLPRWTRARGLLSRDFLGLVDQHWLYPTLVDEATLIRLADVLIDDGVPVLNVFLHSSELHAGSSIYSRSADDVTAVLVRVRRLFEHVIRKRHGRGGTLLQFRGTQVGALRPRELA
jgi:hypothetical protein